MATNVFKVVYTFSADDSNESAWTEVYYVAVADLTSALNAALAVAPVRLRFLHALNNMLAVKVSQLNVPRVAFSQPINLPGGNASGDPMPASTAIIIKLGATGGAASRHIWMRGNSAVDAFRSPTTGQTVFGSGFLSTLPFYTAALKANNFIILKRTPSSVANFAPQSIQGFIPDVASPTTQVVVAGPPLVLQTPPLVIISRCSLKDQPGINGVWNVLGSGVVVGGIFAGANFIRIGYVYPGSNTPVTANTGQVRNLLYETSNIIDPAFCTQEYLNSRQTKGPSSGSRGSRRASRRLRTSP